MESRNINRRAVGFITNPPAPDYFGSGTWDNLSQGPMVQGNRSSPNPWSYIVRFDTCMNGVRYRVAAPNIGQTSEGPYWPPATDPADARCLELASSRPGYLYNTALDRLNENVRGSLDLSVGLAEIGSTRKMFASATKLEKYTQILFASPIAKRYGRIAGSVSHLSKEASKLYLEWKYGAQPLINDIYSAADESVRYVNNAISKFKGSIRESLPKSQRLQRTCPGFTTVFNQYNEGFWSTRFQIKCKSYDSDLSRWTSLNPLSVAYELTPFSFVYDYVQDIGGYLRSLETGLLYQTRFVSGFVDELTVQTSKLDLGGGSGRVGDYFYVTMKADMRYVNFKRTVLGSYPLPRWPMFNANLGSSRLLSCAALLRTVALGHK